MSTELEQVLKAVAEFDRVAAGIKTLESQYAGVVYDVTTAKGMTDAKEARRAIREPRVEIEKIRKAAKAPILELGRKLDSEAARITKALIAIEDPIDEQIKHRERQIENERQAKIAAELKRVEDLRHRITELRGNQSLSASSGSAIIAQHIFDLEILTVDDSFQEFESQARDAKAAGLAQLRELHSAALAHEAEQRRIEAERAELERLRAEQAEREAAERARALEDARRAKEQRDREEAEARAKRAAEEAELRRQREENERAAKFERERIAEEARKVQEAQQKLAEERASIEAAREATRQAQEIQVAAPGTTLFTEDSVNLGPESSGSPGLLTPDQGRIARVATLMDDVGHVNFHERATRYATDHGRNEPSNYDYYCAVCDGLDKVEMPVDATKHRR